MDSPQPELPLPFPAQAGDMPLLPARMVNEYQYCPRLAYLEWVQGEWSESSDTVDGRYRHRRVDRPGGKLPLQLVARRAWQKVEVALQQATAGVLERVMTIHQSETSVLGCLPCGSKSP